MSQRAEGGRFGTVICRVTRPEALQTFGLYAGPSTLSLSSLAEGTKHGYTLTKDIEEFAAVRLARGTLCEALSRLERQGLIEPVERHDRRRPYRLTATGASVLRARLDAQRHVADVGLRRTGLTPRSIFGSSPRHAPAASSETRGISVGVKFTSDVAGTVSGIRFYKGRGSTGLHLGAVWDQRGHLLRTATRRARNCVRLG